MTKKRTLADKLEEVFFTSNLVNQLWDEGYLDDDLNLEKHIPMEEVIEFITNEGFKGFKKSDIKELIDEAKRYCTLIK